MRRKGYFREKGNQRKSKILWKKFRNCEEILKNSFNNIQKKSLVNYYSVENMNEYNKDFSTFFNSLKGNSNRVEIFASFLSDKYPMIIKGFSKILE